MPLTDDERTRALAVFSAAEQMVDGYEQAFQSGRRALAERSDATVLLAAMQFTWLHAKFEHFWSPLPSWDQALLCLRPTNKLFKPEDFEHLVQAILGLVEGEYYR